MLIATYRCNKIIATATIRFIVTVAIVVYKGSIPVVYRILTLKINPPLRININDGFLAIVVLC